MAIQVAYLICFFKSYSVVVKLYFCEMSQPKIVSGTSKSMAGKKTNGWEKNEESRVATTW